MNQIEALQRLETLGTRGFETRDAAALLQVASANAHMILSRLARAGLLTHVSRGHWLLGAAAGFVLAELISAPSPAYISLQSALFHHSMIEQIPAVIYAVTLGRPRRVQTPQATVSFHRMPPELFNGFEVAVDGHSKIATPEKALFDVLYLAPGRSRLFAKLPELEIPRGFRWKELQRCTELVRSPSRRSFLAVTIERLRSKSTLRPRRRSPVQRPLVQRVPARHR